MPDINEPENDNTGDRKQRLRKIIGDGAPEAPKKAPRRRVTKPAGHSVKGNNNIIGDGNVVYLSPPPIVNVQTGVGVITAQQKGHLKDLVSEIFSLERALLVSPRSHAAIWGALLRYVGKTLMGGPPINRYDEIPQCHYEKAKSYLSKQVGRYMNTTPAGSKGPEWRNRRYASINARAKGFAEGERRYRQYAQTKFGTGSLKELDDDQLDAVYRHVFGWRQ